MNIDDRIRRALREAIPPVPAQDPELLADELVRRAGGNGGSGGPSAGMGRAALWIAVLAVLGLGLGWLIGSGGFGSSADTIAPSSTVAVTTVPSTITTVSVATSAPVVTSAPVTTTPPATAPATSSPPPTETTVAPDTTPPSLANASAAPGRIWEQDGFGITCASGTPRQTSISVTVADDGTIAGVTASWPGPLGNNTVSMASSGSFYSTSVGPYAAGAWDPASVDPYDHTFAVTINALDVSGNKSSISVTVTVTEIGQCFG